MLRARILQTCPVIASTPDPGPLIMQLSCLFRDQIKNDRVHLMAGASVVPSCRITRPYLLQVIVVFSGRAHVHVIRISLVLRCVVIIGVHFGIGYVPFLIYTDAHAQDILSTSIILLVLLASDSSITVRLCLVLDSSFLVGI